MEAGQWEQAEQLLNRAVETCPDDAEARRHYAEALWQRGKSQQAVAQLEEASRLAADDPILPVLIARKRLALGDVELARQSAQYAIELDPKLADAWAARGRVYRVSGRLEEALADYHRALGLAPDDQSILWEIAQLYAEMDQPQRALTALHRLADTYPPGEEPQEVLLLEGRVYAALERWDEAAQTLAAASVREPPTPELLFRLGEAELAAGHPARAAQAAQEALTLDPAHQPSRELLSRAELALRPSGSVVR